MTQIERIEKIPQLIWTKHSSQEFHSHHVKAIEEQTDLMWEVSLDVPIAVAGLIYPSLVNPPWLWFLITEDFERRQLSSIRFFSKLIKYIPRGTMTSIKEDFEEGKRFAEFFNFNPEDVSQNGYQVYRRL